MSKKIVVIGSSNIDLIMKMDRLPRQGESVSADIFMQTFGGKGANQAVAAALAGGQVSFVGCVGSDTYGQQVIENLKRVNINVDHLFVEQRIASGTALIMIDADGENYLSIAPGANARLGQDHISQVKELIAEAELIVLQCEIPLETLAYVVETASELGKKIMLNLAPARSLHADVLKRLALLVVNETEAEFLCGFAVDSADAMARAGEALLALGPSFVIITLGVQGAYLATPELRQVVRAFRVEAVDTTAAGDVYCGALAAALVEGKPMLEGMRFASAASAISVTRLGAQPSIPDRSEIDGFLASHP